MSGISFILTTYLCPSLLIGKNCFRFCYSCLITWLSEGRTCPEDNTPLNVEDIFPDTIADREIQQLRVRCAGDECEHVSSVHDYHHHQSQCHLIQKTSSESVTCPQCGELLDQSHDHRHKTLICPNVKVACMFASAGCERKVARKDVQHHLESSLIHHMKLLSEKLTKVHQIQQAEKILCHQHEEEDACTSLPSSPLQREHHQHQQGIRMSGSNLHSQARLIRSVQTTHQSNNIEEIFPLFRELYQKVINLEQNQCQYEIRISQLNSQVEKLKFEKEETFSKSLNGEFVWRIKDFNSIYQKLRHNHNFVIYSKGFYTSYYGYKVCLRSNLYIAKGELSLLSCSRVVFLFCSDN